MGVLESVENHEHNRCVDLFERPDGSFGFEEFRRDAKDSGAWTPVNYFSALISPSVGQAWASALQQVAWLTSS